MSVSERLRAGDITPRVEDLEHPVSQLDDADDRRPDRRRNGRVPAPTVTFRRGGRITGDGDHGIVIGEGHGGRS